MVGPDMMDSMALLVKRGPLAGRLTRLANWSRATRPGGCAAVPRAMLEDMRSRVDEVQMLLPGSAVVATLRNLSETTGALQTHVEAGRT